MIDNSKFLAKPKQIQLSGAQTLGMMIIAPVILMFLGCIFLAILTGGSDSAPKGTDFDIDRNGNLTYQHEPIDPNHFPGQ